MSYRHTYITNFLYKNKCDDELKAIEETLGMLGTVFWRGKDGLGYFYGVIKDLNNIDTRNDMKRFQDQLAKFGARVSIVFED